MFFFITIIIFALTVFNSFSANNLAAPSILMSFIISLVYIIYSLLLFTCMDFKRRNNKNYKSSFIALLFGFQISQLIYGFETLKGIDLKVLFVIVIISLLNSLFGVLFFKRIYQDMLSFNLLKRIIYYVFQMHPVESEKKVNSLVPFLWLAIFIPHIHKSISNLSINML